MDPSGKAYMLDSLHVKVSQQQQQYIYIDNADAYNLGWKIGWKTVRKGISAEGTRSHIP